MSSSNVDFKTNTLTSLIDNEWDVYFNESVRSEMYLFALSAYTLSIFIALVNAQEKIVGGKPAPALRAPYLVSIRERGSHTCGGAIIGPRTILTAAHCVNRQFRKMSVRAGSMGRTSGGTIVRVAGWRRHPKFRKKTVLYDLALIFLKSSLTYNVRIQPIELRDEPLRQFQKGIIVGWGTVREDGRTPLNMRITSIVVTPRFLCHQIYDTLDRSQFCAGIMKGGKDSCQGDSGGPFVVQGRVAGIISVGYGCGERGLPGIYTRIRLFRKWIRRYA